MENKSLNNICDDFNDRLRDIAKGDNKNYKPLFLGMPSPILLSCGFPNFPIEITVKRLTEKKEQENHKFTFTSVIDMPEHIANPIAVFQSKTKANRKVVLTEMEHKNVNMVVAIELNMDKGALMVNDIRSVYPKDNIIEILSWMFEHDLMEYVDKNKLLNWFDKRRSNSAEVTKLIKHNTNIIQNFENPQIPTKNKESDNQVDKILSTGGTINSALKEGIKIEKEHKDLYIELKKRLEEEGAKMPFTETEFFAWIAKAHLREKEDYYDLLKKYVENENMKKEIKAPSGTFYAKIKPIREGAPELTVRVSTDEVGDFIAGYQVYHPVKSTKKVAYFPKATFLLMLEQNEYTIIPKEEVKFEEGGSIYKKGTEVLVKDDDGYFTLYGEIDHEYMRDGNKLFWVKVHPEKGTTISKPYSESEIKLIDKMEKGGEVLETNDTKYWTTEFTNKGNKYSVGFAWGKYNHINVSKLTNNPFRKLGKEFKNIDEAIAHYKDANIRTQLIFAENLAKEKGYVPKFEKGGVIAKGTMNTPDGEIEGKVVYNDYWKKYQVNIDGTIYEEFRTPEEAISNLEGAGFKNVKKFESGGGVPNNKRVMRLHDAVIYDGKTHYITKKDGIIGLTRFGQGAWGTDYPFIPLSEIPQSEITDMMGREVVINEKFERGGGVSAQPSSGADSKKTATVLIISNKNPLSTQLEKITGKTYNSIDFEDDEITSNPSVIREISTGRLFVIFTLNYFAQVDKYVIDDNLSFVKHVYGVTNFHWQRKPKFEQGGLVDGELEKETINGLKVTRYENSPSPNKTLVRVQGNNGSETNIMGIVYPTIKYPNKVTNLEAVAEFKKHKFEHGGDIPSETENTNLIPTPMYTTVKQCLLADGDNENDFIAEGSVIYTTDTNREKWHIKEFYKLNGVNGAVLCHIPNSDLNAKIDDKHLSLSELRNLFESGKIEVGGIEAGNTRIFNICLKSVSKCIDMINLENEKHEVENTLSETKEHLDLYHAKEQAEAEALREEQEEEERIGKELYEEETLSRIIERGRKIRGEKELKEAIELAEGFTTEQLADTIAGIELALTDMEEGEDKEALVDYLNGLKVIAEEKSGSDVYEKGGEIPKADIESLANGYKEAILFTSNDDEDEPLDSNYSIGDFNKKSNDVILKMAKQYIIDNKDAIEESGLDYDQVGRDIWYTQAGHGVGFFDRNLEKDVEEKLTKGAKKFGDLSHNVFAQDGEVFIEGMKFAQGGSVGKINFKLKPQTINAHLGKYGYDDKANRRVKNWNVDDFASYVKDYTTFEGDLTSNPPALLKEIFPDGKLPFTANTVIPTGANGDKNYKKYGTRGAVMYDIWEEIVKENNLSPSDENEVIKEPKPTWTKQDQKDFDDYEKLYNSLPDETRWDKGSPITPKMWERHYELEGKLNLIADKEGKEMKYEKGGDIDDYKKSLGMVEVIFKDPKYNYFTSVSGTTTEEDARKYFVGQIFDMGRNEEENMQKAIDIKFHAKGTYEKGGKIGGRGFFGLKKGKPITNIDDLKKGDIILGHSKQFNSDNTFKIVGKRQYGNATNYDMVYWNPKTNERIGSEEMSITDYDLTDKDFYFTKQSASKKKSKQKSSVAEA